MDAEPAAGAGLGLPTSGPGRLASWGVRVAALTVDWFACLFASFVFASPAAVVSGDARWLPLVLLVVESAVLTATLGGSAGQLVLGVRVRPLGGRRSVDIARALLRSVLVALVLPAVVYDRDRRGLHDRAAGTVVISSR